MAPVSTRTPRAIFTSLCLSDTLLKSADVATTKFSLQQPPLPCGFPLSGEKQNCNVFPDTTGFYGYMRHKYIICPVSRGRSSQALCAEDPQGDSTHVDGSLQPAKYLFLALRQERQRSHSRGCLQHHRCISTTAMLQASFCFVGLEKQTPVSPKGQRPCVPPLPGTGWPGFSCWSYLHKSLWIQIILHGLCSFLFLMLKEAQLGSSC